jgi:hypothetical protein
MKEQIGEKTRREAKVTFERILTVSLNFSVDMSSMKKVYFW